jgi:malonate-semialdehyde dehydrogenase (acetylating)/methylmalonate-semialdehyde dehydrogenase
MAAQIGHWIDGKRVAGAYGQAGDVFDPATGEVTRTVAFATAEETRQVIDAAQRALPDWAARTPLARARVLFRFKYLIEAHFDELARLITAEHGKTLADARGEVKRGMEVIEFACGNTFVLKPSEKDPSCPLRLAELLAEAGLPAGVFNLVNGDGEAADTLLTDERVATVSFVGSTPVAESVYRVGSDHGKRVQALGGAKNHIVVMPDADTDSAANALLGAAYGSAGERCMAVSVAVAVGEATSDRLVEALAPKVEALEVGPGTRDTAEMGPLVTAAHREHISGYVDLGIQEGAQLVVDRRAVTVAGHEGGFYLGPSLFDRVTPDMRIYQEEIFGPVLVVVRVTDFDSALKLVSDHQYGNGTAIFTHDGATARAFAERVACGMVGINVPIPVPMAFHSFGGWKRSLFGPLHVHGPEGVRFYTRMKTVTARWSTDEQAPAQFAMPTMQ